MSTISKSPRATMITIYSLGALLGILHIVLGVFGLSPAISQDYHREVKINYSAFSKSLLNLYEFTDRVTLAQYLRLTISAAQIIFGSLLLENGIFGPYGKIGNFALIAVDIIVFLLQFSVGTPLERIAPTIVFAILLVARLVILEQATKKVRVGVKTRNAGKPKSSTPKKNKNE